MTPARQRAPVLMEHHFLAMGTAILVTVDAGDESRRAAAARAIAEVQKLLLEFGSEGWAWGGGALASFNRDLACGAVARIPLLLRALFERAWEIRQVSEGLFEPRIGALVRLWGFDDPQRIRSAPPQAEEIQALLHAVRAAPDYDGAEFYGPAPGICWDLGAIGKGYIVDMALDWLRRRGFADAIVNAGGNVAARGSRGDRPWHIGVRDPRTAAELPQLLASLDVYDESVITHGDDQRYFEHQERRYSHILHPHSGQPTQGLRSLTVVHRDGTLADGGGAALFVAGSADWPRLAQKLGIKQVLAVDEDGAVSVSERLAARLQVAAGLRVTVVH
jgi:thiamine biosynthesis lipoprotein